MQPSQGRMVIAKGGAARSNGSETAPALITNVFAQPDGGYLCNVTIFPDAAQPVVRTSVRLYHDETAVDAAVAAMHTSETWHESMTVLYWLPQV